jgi:small ligand-binding sensory domain FIST
VAAIPRTGQTVQFHLRAANAGTEDMVALLEQARTRLQDTPVYGGCLCSCNGRGRRLCGEPDHDAKQVQ